MAKRTKKKNDDVAIKINFIDDGTVPIVFVNHVFVRRSDDVFLISFAQAHGPFETKLDTLKLAKTGVSANVVAKLAIPPNRFKEIFLVLAEQFARLEDESRAKD